MGRIGRGVSVELPLQPSELRHQWGAAPSGCPMAATARNSCSALGHARHAPHAARMAEQLAWLGKTSPLPGVSPEQDLASFAALRWRARHTARRRQS